MTGNLASRYLELYESVLVPSADLLRKYLQDCVEELPHIDAVVARAKSPTRFASKALKEIDGQPKYTYSLNEIQDQIGARITVFYLKDIENVKSAIDDYFTPIEWQKKQPESNAEFGYFGDHYILPLPDDVVPDGMESKAPKFFELQIKTLFQHAWSEACHDIGYKAPRALTPLEQRQMAFSAAQAWGADQIFEALASDLADGTDLQ